MGSFGRGDRGSCNFGVCSYGNGYEMGPLMSSALLSGASGGLVPVSAIWLLKMPLASWGSN